MDKPKHWRERLHQTIYESNTVSGRAFDIALLILIIASIIVVMLDSVKSFQRHAHVFDMLEWGFTILFTIEYVLRLISIRHPWRYVGSFLGVVDLLAIIPSYLSFFYCGCQFAPGVACLAVTSGFPDIQADAFSHRNAIPQICYPQQPEEDQHLYAGGTEHCNHHGFGHVPG